MKTSENKRILLLLIFLIILLLAPIVYLTYFTIFKAQDAINNPANKRPIMAENSIRRGNIYDRDGNVVAYSIGEKYQYQRVYNYPVVYSHIVGYSNKIVAKYGLEKEYNDYLVGKNDSKLLKIFKSLFNKKLDLNVGDSITLTTSTDLQKKTRSVLGQNNEKGSVVIMNPKSGEILSMISLPDFNSQNIAKDMEQINKNNNGALFNNSTLGKFAPGSVFKIITADAILESGISQKYNDKGVEKIDKGRKFKNSTGKAYGNINLKSAFTYSINTYFVRKTVDIGLDLFSDVCQRFMINKKVDFDLPLETSTWNYTREGFDKTALASAGIGHDDILVTPLQMCMIASAIANDGVMMKPHLVKSIDSSDGKNILTNNPEVLSESCSKENANIIRDMMINVVNNGTGTEAYVRGYQVAGKTGTAQFNITEGTNNAWFVGFAPADDPKIAISVVIPNVSKYGGEIAAPIAGELIRYALDNINFDQWG